MASCSWRKYKDVTLAILLAEASFYADRLDLPVTRPITEKHLTFGGLPRPNNCT